MLPVGKTRRKPPCSPFPERWDLSSRVGVCLLREEALGGDLLKHTATGVSHSCTNSATCRPSPVQNHTAQHSTLVWSSHPMTSLSISKHHVRMCARCLVAWRLFVCVYGQAHFKTRQGQSCCLQENSWSEIKDVPFQL